MKYIPYVLGFLTATVVAVGVVTIMAVASSKQYIENYTGVGSGVLKHGTLLELKQGEQYSDPKQIVGEINRPGTWVIRTEE